MMFGCARGGVSTPESKHRSEPSASCGNNLFFPTPSSKSASAPVSLSPIGAHVSPTFESTSLAQQRSASPLETEIWSSAIVFFHIVSKGPTTCCVGTKASQRSSATFASLGAGGSCFCFGEGAFLFCFDLAPALSLRGAIAPRGLTSQGARGALQIEAVSWIRRTSISIMSTCRKSTRV